MKQLLILIIFLMANTAFAEWRCCKKCGAGCCAEYQDLEDMCSRMQMRSFIMSKILDQQKTQITQLDMQNNLFQEQIALLNKQNALLKEHIKIGDPSLYEPLIQAPNLQLQNEILMRRLPPQIMFRYLPPPQPMPQPLPPRQ